MQEGTLGKARRAGAAGRTGPAAIDRQQRRRRAGSRQQGTPEGVDADALRKVLENVANKKLQYLDQLPQDPAGQIKSLTEYDFMDDQARQEFQELVQS